VVGKTPLRRLTIGLLGLTLLGAGPASAQDLCSQLTIPSQLGLACAPAADPGTVEVTPFKEILGRDARLMLWMLMGVAALVLVIACANVANLTLMRGVRREHEMTVRAALGAGASRLRKLLLMENLVLAGGGAILGLLVAIAGVGTLSRFVARFSPRADEIHVDWMVLAFTALLAVLIAFLLSFAPRVGSEHALGAGLAAGSVKTTGSGRRKRLQQALGPHPAVPGRRAQSA